MHYKNYIKKILIETHKINSNLNKTKVSCQKIIKIFNLMNRINNKKIKIKKNRKVDNQITLLNKKKWHKENNLHILIIKKCNMKMLNLIYIVKLNKLKICIINKL